MLLALHELSIAHIEGIKHTNSMNYMVYLI